MSTKRILLIVRKPPGVVPDAWEALRFALSLYAADAPVTVAFEGLGVTNGMSRVAVEPTNAYSTRRLIHDLEGFGIPLYFAKEDLAAYPASDGNLSSHARLIPREELAVLVAGHDVTIAF